MSTNTKLAFIFIAGWILALFISNIEDGRTLLDLTARIEALEAQR